MHEYWKLCGAMLFPCIGGFANGYISSNNLENWYQRLRFPSYRPPNYLFGPIWSTLYSGMGYASYLVWKDGGGFTGDAKLPLLAYGTQLALNWAWTPIFFGCRNIKGGLIDLVALTASATACGILFYSINKTAGYIFIPYVAWLGFACLLNYSIYKLNTETDDDDDDDLLIQPAIKKSQ